MKTPVITLTSDFGLKDPFAGLMKGAILGINPDAKIVDISHNIERHNIFEASQVIAMSYKYFPPATIHVAVIDPGVGSTRRPLIVVTDKHYFIGPDNGIFTPILKGPESSLFSVIHITASHYFLPMSGSTFHGRDIFAPVAAWLSKGVDSSNMGERIDDFITIEWPMPEANSDTLTGQIVSIDTFGNAISNIKKDDLDTLVSAESGKQFRIMYNNEQLPFVQYYGENATGSVAAIMNSFGHIELFIFGKSAAELYNIKIGDPVTLRID